MMKFLCAVELNIRHCSHEFDRLFDRQLTKKNL